MSANSLLCTSSNEDTYYSESDCSGVPSVERLLTGPVYHLPGRDDYLNVKSLRDKECLSEDSLITSDTAHLVSK